MTHLIRALKIDFLRVHQQFKSRIACVNIDAEIERLLELHLEVSDNVLHSEKDSKKCWGLMCGRICKPHFTPQAALGLLDVDFKDIRIRKIAIQAFDILDNEEFECYLGYLVHKIIYNNSYDFTTQLDPQLVELILKKSEANIRVANSVYWQLDIGKHSKQTHTFQKCEALLIALSERLNTSYKHVIYDITKYVNTIETNYSSDDPIDIMRELSRLKTCVAPTHPEKGVWNIESGAVSMKKSITKPICVPLVKGSLQVEGSTCKPEVLMELWKKEDIRPDATIIPAIRLMNLIWKRELGLDLNIVTYNTQPTGPDSGFIEIVQNCNTLYNIETYSKLSLLNYIIESNPDTNVTVLRQRFINSCAAYAVITKLLGICDRHLDNIMMTDKGELFHIDYGYILGRDPKDRFINLSEMRITDEMVNAIGGESSASYQQFKDLCSELYNCLRRYTNTFEYLLMLLVETEPRVCGDWLTREKLYQEIAKQFEPNSTYKEAEIRIYSRIDNSTSTASGYRWRVIDFFHKHNKEKTVRTAVSSTISVTAKSTKNFLMGVWDYLTTTGDNI